MKKPKYALLLDWIRDQIDKGRLREGSKLPSENELCAQFGISRQTVRQALGLLESEHVIERRRGSGTFIAGQSQPARPRNIGILSTYIDDYIFPSIIRGIERVLSAKGYSMQLHITHDRIESEQRALQSLLDAQIAGVIVEPTKSALPNPNLPIYRELAEKHIPVVFFNAFYPSIDIPYVALDDRQAGDLATEHLISKGHTRIAALLQCEDIQGHLRYAGYLDALTRNELPIASEHILWFATEDIPDLFANPRLILRRLRDCTAVLCYNDQIATQLSAFLLENGIRVPEDTSLISIDNDPRVEHCAPPLTTVNHPKEMLGKSAAENLLALLEGRSVSKRSLFSATLVERDSVRGI